MAKKISQLTQATQVKSDDVTVIVQDGETKKLPLNMMVTKQDIENKKVAGLAKLDEIEATYENDTYTPTITVKNKSSVKVGEGDGVDYSANVMDGPAKSAILSGQTLVNLSEINKFSISGGGTKISTSLKMMKDNTFYTRIVYITKNTLTGVNERNNVAQIIGLYVDNTLFNIDRQIALNETGLICKECINSGDLSSKSSASHIRVFTVNTGGVLEGYEIIVEGDYTNQDIPYFTGMQSVKLPVLTTTGKNLFDMQTVYNINENATITNNSITLDVGTKEEFITACLFRLNINKHQWGKIIRISSTVVGKGAIEIRQRDESNKQLSAIVSNNSNVTILDNTKYLELNFNSRRKTGVTTWSNIQIEGGTTATPYEPFKSNILSASEDVTLRGIGEVQDTLDCLTGEVTQRVGEVVLDGSEDEEWIYWNSNTTLVTGFYSNVPLNNAALSSHLVICDSIPSTEIRITELDKENIFSSQSGRINLNILNSKATTVDELKIYLSSNPITVQYRLATESIKTVDLMPSGTHPSTTPYCWKNGHIQLSSSGLLPNLEYSVVTSRAGQINQNATMVVKNDKRIFDLEILLAGGLVNTTYQALTLQNQVETGLSKASLNSETEPDYLLYHMIMKLIEEKAYKLDDLAEKVSVFYLYEKLSDEQFETIYSELYPFVEEEYIELPEDGEIIEEPIVDEVLEEVENGVVM